MALWQSIFVCAHAKIGDRHMRIDGGSGAGRTCKERYL